MTSKSFKDLFKETDSGDIAIFTPAMKLSKKEKKCTKDCEEIEESAVGSIGRTDAISAMAHLSPELKKRFRKLLKDIGGKTVMRYLLSDTPLQEDMNGKLRGDIKSSLYTLQSNCNSKKMEDAIDEVLDLIDICK